MVVTCLQLNLDVIRTPERERTMTEDEFWRLIDQSRVGCDPQRRDGNMGRQVADLRALLSKLSAEDVHEFSKVLSDVFDRTYSWDLWGAAHVIASGCSDDWFDYFRYWLISMGRHVYENALVDPESLATAAGRPDVEDIFFEEFGYVADMVLEERGAPRGTSVTPSVAAEPSGQPWTQADLPERFPW